MACEPTKFIPLGAYFLTNSLHSTVRKYTVLHVPCVDEIHVVLACMITYGACSYPACILLKYSTYCNYNYVNELNMYKDNKYNT